MEKSLLEESTRFVVNSDYFSPRDFALFVESLETAWRVQRQRKIRLANGEERKRTNSDDENLDSSEEDAIDDMHMQSKSKKVMLEKEQVDDENYFSGSSGNSPIVGIHCDTQTNVNGTDVQNISDSEDSGFYPVGHIYENVATIIHPLSRRQSSHDRLQGTLRSRLIKIVRKHSMLQKRKEGDRLAEINNKKFKFATLSLRRKPKIQADVKQSQESEMNFITRALSYLTF